MSPRPIVFVVENSRNAGCGLDHAVLIEQRQLALHFQHALDDEHHIGTAGVIFVEHERDGVLQRPGQKTFAELRDLLAVAQHDRVLADQIDAADMAVEIDADAGPVEARGDLLDMRRFAGAVIALDHHAAVERKAGENGERRFAVEAIGRIALRNIFVRFRERRHLHRRVDAEERARIDLRVGHEGGIEALWLCVHGKFVRV